MEIRYFFLDHHWRSEEGKLAFGPQGQALRVMASPSSWTAQHKLSMGALQGSNRKNILTSESGDSFISSLLNSPTFMSKEWGPPQIAFNGIFSMNTQKKC